MGQVAISINGRDYQISCDDGQEDRLRHLAGYIEERIAELGHSVGSVGELRLMVMTCLVIADTLFDVNAEAEQLRAELIRARAAPPADVEALVAPLIEAVSERIENIAERLESA